MKIVELVKSAKFCLKNPDPILITEDIENILRLTSEKLDSKMLEVEELKKSGW